MRSDNLSNNPTSLAALDRREQLDSELANLGLGLFEVYQCGPTLDEAETITNHPEVLQPPKVDEGYQREQLLSLSKRRIKPFFWSDENLLVNADEEGHAPPVAEGASFIVHGNQGFYSILNLCSLGESHRFRETVQAHKSDIQMLLVSVYDESLESSAPIPELPTSILTPRETEVLSWTSIGKTYNEISLLANMSPRTVKFHMKNIFNKLEVNNGKSAIRKALQLGYIKEPE